MTSHTRPLMVHHLSRAPTLTVGASQLLKRMPCRGLGGLSLINAGLTVFLARPTTRAICEIDMPSDHRKRRIFAPVSYTHLRAHETRHDLVCRLLLEKKKQK